MANGWREGTIGIPVKDGGTKIAHYWVNVFEEPSEDYGINGGKISKLSIKIDGAWVANYDRGWVEYPISIFLARFREYLILLTCVKNKLELLTGKNK